MPRRYLVVDDDESIFMAYKKLLQSSERELDTATTLEDVKALLSSREYDILITDLRLSGVGNEEGFEITRLVRERYPNTKIVMVTAYGDAGIRERAYRMGVSLYFEKPISIRVLECALESLKIEGTDHENSQ